MSEVVNGVKETKNKENIIKNRISNKLEEFSELKCLYNLTGNLLFKRNLTLVLQERINKSLNITSNKSRIPKSVDLFNIKDIINHVYGDYIKRHNIDVDKEVKKVAKEKEKKMREINSYAYLAKNKRPYFNQKYNYLVNENNEHNSSKTDLRKNYSIVSSKYTKKIVKDNKNIKNRNKKSSKENNSVFDSNTRLSKISNITRKISDNIKDFNDTISESSYSVNDSFFSKTNTDYFYDKSNVQQIGKNCSYYTIKTIKKRKVKNKINGNGSEFNTNVVTIYDNNKYRDYTKNIINSAKKFKNKVKDIKFIRTNIKKINELKNESNFSDNKSSNRSNDMIINSRVNGSIHEIKNFTKKNEINNENDQQNENKIIKIEINDLAQNQENNNYILTETLNNDTNDEESVEVVNQKLGENAINKKINEIKLNTINENIKEQNESNLIENQNIIKNEKEIDIEKNTNLSNKKKYKRQHKHHHHYEHNGKPRRVILSTKTDVFSLKGKLG